jgi:hypothetical protein
VSYLHVIKKQNIIFLPGKDSCLPCKSHSDQLEIPACDWRAVSIKGISRHSVYPKNLDSVSLNVTAEAGNMKQVRLIEP